MPHGWTALAGPWGTVAPTQSCRIHDPPRQAWVVHWTWTPDVVHERHQKIGHGTLHSNHMVIQIRPLGHLRTAGPTRYGMRISSRPERESRPQTKCAPRPAGLRLGENQEPTTHQGTVGSWYRKGGLRRRNRTCTHANEQKHVHARTRTSACTYTHKHAQTRTSTHKHAQARTHALKSNRTTATAPSAGPAGGTGTTATRPSLGRSVGT
jgi:hypothetical protein